MFCFSLSKGQHAKLQPDTHSSGHYGMPDAESKAFIVLQISSKSDTESKVSQVLQVQNQGCVWMVKVLQKPSHGCRQQIQEAIRKQRSTFLNLCCTFCITLVHSHLHIYQQEKGSKVSNWPRHSMEKHLRRMKCLR